MEGLTCIDNGHLISHRRGSDGGDGGGSIHGNKKKNKEAEGGWMELEDDSWGGCFSVERRFSNILLLGLAWLLQQFSGFGQGDGFWTVRLGLQPLSICPRLVQS